MDSREGIFEIREYIDSSGNVEKSDVRDISAELEYFSKLCAEQGQLGDEMHNEDDDFIRELAYIPDRDDDIGMVITAPQGDISNLQAARSPVNVGGGNSTKAKSNGWSKGFLQAKATKKPSDVLPRNGVNDEQVLRKQKNDVPELQNAAAISDKCAIQPVEPLEARNVGVENQSADKLATVEPVEPVEPTRNTSVGSAPLAFSGSVVERTVPSTAVGAKGKSSGVILGPKKR